MNKIDDMSNSEPNEEINSPEKIIPETRAAEILHQSNSKKMQSVLQELKIMATQKSSRGGFDISKFDKEQVDKLLDTVSENEKNAFQFHIKRIDAIKEIELERIKTSSINKRTVKFVAIGGIIFVLPIITMLILFFKETFFIPWLTFLTGILGGFGVSKMTTGLFNNQDKNPLLEETEEEDK